ncbi:DUF3438 family protein [Thiosulfatimonas sediminis]|nr:DUF3438 family protein [Thiosulfatimonas sediminis]
MMKRLMRFFALSCCLMPGMAFADEHINWDGTPVDISVSSGLERQIVFPSGSSIAIGVSGQSMANYKTLSSVDNRVFIQAVNDDLAREKIIFKDQVSGRNYVVYVSGVKAEGVDPIVNVHLPKKAEGMESVKSSGSQEGGGQNINSYPFLTRYVFQHVYSPERLVKDHSLINRVSVEPIAIKNLFGCFGGSVACTSLIATPIVSYRTDQFYATAIEVKNISDYAVEVDARMIARSPRDLLAATFMHHRLLPANEGKKAGTVLVMIHKRPLREFFYDQELGR